MSRPGLGRGSGRGPGRGRPGGRPRARRAGAGGGPPGVRVLSGRSSGAAAGSRRVDPGPAAPRGGGARPAREAGQDSLPVFSTFCSSVLALLTVALKLAPCIRAFIMFGMIWSVASAVAQFLLFSGEIWVVPAALAKPAMIGLLEYTPLVSCEVNSGKKPWELAKVVALLGLSMTCTRSQAAVLFGLLAHTPRSDPPAKAGAGFGPVSLGIGNEPHCEACVLLTASSEDSAHGPSMYMSSVPLAKSSSLPPDVAPGAPSSVWPMYLAGETCWVSSRSA